jgi:hypothetical protein
MQCTNVITYIYYIAFLGKNWWIITKINYSAQKQTGVAMPGYNKYNYLHVSSIQLPIARYLGDPVPTVRVLLRP